MPFSEIPLRSQGQRSDTIMLLRVVPASSSIALLSIPRDLLVPVAGMGTTRINATFDSGPNLLISTIENDLGIDINHFMVVNFYSFTQLSDSLGGVYQYFPAPARDLYSDLSVPHAGCVLLKGQQALAFVRSREYQYYLNGSWQYQLVPESDLARIQRQQDFVKLAIKKAEAVGPTDPLALNAVIGGVTSSLAIDNTFTNSLMLTLAKVLRHANAAGIPDWTYPTVNSYEVPGALDPVPSEDQAMLKQFLDYGMPATTSAKTANGDMTFSLAAKVFDAAAHRGSGRGGQPAQHHAGFPGRDGLLVVLPGPIHTAGSSTGPSAGEVPLLGTRGRRAARVLGIGQGRRRLTPSRQPPGGASGLLHGPAHG